jgi:hypothetical protein
MGIFHVDLTSTPRRHQAKAGISSANAATAASPVKVLTLAANAKPGGRHRGSRSTKVAQFLER